MSDTLQFVARLVEPLNNQSALTPGRALCFVYRSSAAVSQTLLLKSYRKNFC